MRKILLFSATAALLAACESKPVETASYDVIPAPLTVAVDSSAKPFTLSPSTVITYPKGDSALLSNAELLAEYVATLIGAQLKITDKPASSNAIALEANLQNQNPEAYTLSVGSKLVTINGASPAGNFYGIQTLRKSLPESRDRGVLLPAVEISDAPRFAYRGTHLDVARHFFTADSVKQYIDILALHNVNNLHWHLSDDQGWRIQLDSYPMLTEKGSMRRGTCIGMQLSTCDSIPYGGFYTKNEIKDIIDYAAKRHINVIPEIDMPGHMLAALSAYPNLGCDGGPYEPWTRWGVSEKVLCAGNDSTYAFVDGVLTELASIFPSEYVHIGGDECPKAKWQKCPKCQARIKELGLKTDKNSTAEQKLQTLFMTHACNTLAALGKKAIGWDEIIEGGFSPGVTVMCWRGDGKKSTHKAVEAGHDVILTPGAYCYFDYVQADSTWENPLTWAGPITIDKVYSMEPIDSTFTPEQAAHILGVQCNVWTELMPSMHYAQAKLLPRLAALSEVQWSAPEKRDSASFHSRLPRLIKLYDAEGFNHFDAAAAEAAQK